MLCGSSKNVACYHHRRRNSDLPSSSSYSRRRREYNNNNINNASSKSFWKRRHHERNILRNDAIYDEEIEKQNEKEEEETEVSSDVESQDGLIGERDARLYAQTLRADEEEDLEKNETVTTSRRRRSESERDFLHESLGITYRFVEKGGALECDLDALNDVFVSVNFSRRPNDKLYLALEKSYLCCFAEVDVEYETRALDANNNSVESTIVETRREVIGFARMTSDAAFVATVWDLVVAPPYQGKGIGTAIVERMIAKAKETAPGMVVNLCAVAEAESMYKRIGFRRNEKEIIAMQFNPELQAMQRYQSVDFSIQ